MTEKEIDLAKFLPADDQVEQLIEEALNKGFVAAKGREPKSADERRTWVREENGARVMNSVPPVAFAVEAKGDLKDPESFLTPSVQLMPVVNPLFHALLVKLGAKHSGARSYEIAAGKGKNAAERDQIVKTLTAILEVIPGSVCYSPECIEEADKKGFESWNISRYKVFRDIYCLIRDTAAGERIEKPRLNDITFDHPTQKSVAARQSSGEDVSREAPLVGAAIIISSAKGRIFVKVATNRVGGQGLFLSDEPGTPDLDRLRPNNILDPQAVTPDRALTLMEEAAEQGYTVVDPDGTLDKIKSKLSKMVVAQRVPGSPGQSRLVVGGKVSSELGQAAQRLPKKGAVRVATVPAGQAGVAVKAAEAAGRPALIDEHVQDIINMAHADPAPTDDPSAELILREYQREAVGLHMATEVGYLQACSVGLGKTAITLRGMQGHAAKKVSEEA